MKSKLILQVAIATLVTTLATAGIVIAATTVGNSVSIGGTLGVTGATTLSSATLSSTLAVTGATTLSATTTISANGASVLGVNNLSGVPIFEVDTTNSRASTTALAIGGGTTVSKLLFGTCAVDPQSITMGTSSPVSTSCAATGVVSGDTVFVTPPIDTEGASNWLQFEGASASSTTGYIEITLFNASSTRNIDGPSRTWKWMAIR